eukprot:12850601-Alexandrium_andersonii.AAC.1
MSASLVGSEMCIRDRSGQVQQPRRQSKSNALPPSRRSKGCAGKAGAPPALPAPPVAHSSD